jgi:hypothetical protein
VKRLKILTIGLVMGTSLLLSSFGLIARAESSDVNANLNKTILLQEALKEFGARSPIEAAQLWSKGIQTRNGVLQYSVMDKKLKKAFGDGLDQERSSWTTGFSSPWVKGFKVVGRRRAGWGKTLITVEFNLESATGEEASGHAGLLVAREGRFWVIRRIDRSPNLLGF